MEAMTSTPDLVIRGGTIADGKGGELFEADVAISGGRISEVGAQAEGGALGVRDVEDHLHLGPESLEGALYRFAVGDNTSEIAFLCRKNK